MSEVKISAEPRTEFGKGGARRTRRAGKVPAVLYGHGEKPKHIALPDRELAAALRHGGMTQVLNIEMPDGTTALVLPKALQRDPIKDTFQHIDLLVVRRGEMVTAEVPVQLTGEPARDALVVHEHNTVTILGDATRLPDHVEASIDGLPVGSRVTAADIRLPEGASLAGDPEQVIAVLTGAPSGAEPEAEQGAEEPEQAQQAAVAAAGGTAEA